MGALHITLYGGLVQGACQRLLYFTFNVLNRLNGLTNSSSAEFQESNVWRAARTSAKSQVSTGSVARLTFSFVSSFDCAGCEAAVFVRDLWKRCVKCRLERLTFGTDLSGNSKRQTHWP